MCVVLCVWCACICRYPSKRAHGDPKTTSGRRLSLMVLQCLFLFCFLFAYIVDVSGYTGATLVEVRGQFGGVSSLLPLGPRDLTQAGKRLTH